MRSTISAVVITQNEEDHVVALMESLTWVDEVIVIDSFSTDQTKEIFEKHGAIVHQREFDNFSAQRNYSISKASKDWVLCIDSDERVSPELATEIESMLQVDEVPNAYRIKIHNYLNQKRVMYSGWTEDQHVRLFQRIKGEYTDELVHELLSVPKPHGLMEYPLLHYTRISLSKVRKYAGFQAGEINRSNKSVFYIWQVLWRPLFRFLETLIYRKGILDGFNGIQIASKDGLEVAYKLIYFVQLRMERGQENDGI